MELLVTRYLQIKNHRVILNGALELAFKEQPLESFLRALNRHYAIGYPKFYKMDNLCKLGFLSADILLKGTSVLQHYPEEEIGIILENGSSSLDTDKKHQKSINDRSHYFPSPSVFVYTLANIMIGEIAIRHKIKGENAVLVTERFEPLFLTQMVSELFQQKRIQCCLSGWIECYDRDYESYLFIVERAARIKRLKKSDKSFGFDSVVLEELYENTLRSE